MQLQITAHVSWLANTSIALSNAMSVNDLLTVIVHAVTQLTGCEVVACRKAAERALKHADSGPGVQFFPFTIQPGEASATLIVHAPELTPDLTDAICALLTIVEPRLQDAIQTELSAHLSWEETVIRELHALLLHAGEEDALRAEIIELAERTFSPDAASIAVSKGFSVPDKDANGDDQAIDAGETRLLERFIHAIQMSRRFNLEDDTDPVTIRHLNALRDVTLAAASIHDLRELYGAVRDVLRRVVQTDAMLIAMIPPGEAEAVTVFRSERETLYFERTSLSPPFQQAMKYGKPFIIADLPPHLYTPEYRFGDPTRRVRSLAGAPLFSNDTVSGLLVVQSYEPDAYQMEHATLLLNVGRNIAVALERADLLDRLRAQSARETALRTIAERVTTTLDMRELLKIAVSETAPVLSHQLMAAISIEESIDESAPPLVTHIAAQGTDPVMETAGITAHSRLDPDGIAARVASTHEIVVTEESERSVIALPLLADSGCIGIFLISRHLPARFSDDDLALLRTLSGTLASALRTAQLYTNRSQHERDLLEVQRVSRLVASSLNPDAILSEIIVSLPQLFDAEGCSVRMVEGDALVPLAEYGDIVSTFAPRIPIATSLAGTIIREKRVVAVSDLHTHPFTRETALSTGITVRGWMGAPMIDADGEVIGNLSVHSDQPRQWSERDMALLQTLAGSTALAIQNAWRFERTRDVLFASIESLAAAVDAKDPSTLNHSRNVSEYARRIAEALGCTAEEVETITLAGLLHDVGKIGIPDRILQKQDALDSTEWEKMKTHSVIGEQILSGNPHLTSILPMVRHHHERWNGSGYPDGLEGGQIPLGAAIVAVADAVDTMANSRPYREALDWSTVQEQVSTCAGRQFHPDAARTFLDLARTGRIVPLTSGTEPAVASLNSPLAAQGHSLDARALMIFHGVAREIRALTDLDTFIANVSTVIQDVMEVATVSIYLVDEKANAIVKRATPLERMRGMRDVRRDNGQGVVGWVVQHAAPVMVPDVTLDSRFIGRPGSVTRSELAVPLIADGRVIGAINVESDRVAAFSNMDDRLLLTTADHIAQTIQVARLHDHFKQLAATDALTGLANHRAFYDRLDEEIRHAALTDGVLTVAIMDVDQLKTINDTYGHLAGDAALREIAAVLKDRCRRSDLVCRYGGDEFAMILADTDLPGADRAIGHVVAGINASALTIDGHRHPLPSGAWGMATYPDDGMRASELVRVADLRMYSHKRHARSHHFDSGN